MSRKFLAALAFTSFLTVSAIPCQAAVVIDPALGWSSEFAWASSLFLLGAGLGTLGLYRRYVRKFMLSCVIVLPILFFIGEAKATLLPVEGTGIPINWGNPVSPVTADTETGLQWLNVYQIGSGGYYHAYDFLQTNLSPGGEYYGWRLASAAQVLTLFEHAGLPSNIFGFHDTNGPVSDAVIALQRLVGGCWTGTVDDFSYTWAIVSDSSGPGWLSRVGFETWGESALKPGGAPGEPSDYYWKVSSSSDGVNPLAIADYDGWNDGPNPMGAWLVREQSIPVPEPSTTLLTGIGLVILAVWAKRSAIAKFTKPRSSAES